jgi:hypothetical protein
VICNLGVVGSNPTRGSERKKHSGILLGCFFFYILCRSGLAFDY